MKKGLWLCLAAHIVAGCAGNVQWRASSVSSPAVQKASSDGPYLDVERYRTTLYSEPGVRQSNFQASKPRDHTTAYIEFDEQGDYRDRNQLVDALKNIPIGPRRLVVFYAHGWQNDTRSGDVGQFNALLAHLAHTLNEKVGAKAGELPWEVFGVYLSWRGTIYDPSDIYPPQKAVNVCSVQEILSKARPSPTNTLASVPKLFTFWSRKDAAGRFAGAPLLEAINMISARARTQAPPGGAHLETKTILIGHSFGAYVIEKTVLQSVSTISPEMASGGTSYITPPADLVILLNSAAPAIYAKEFIEFLKWHSVGRDQKPFVISVSSEGDWATKDVFPLGTIPASAFDVGSYRGKASYQGANEKTFFTHTPGHTPYLASFDAYPTGGVPKDEFTADYQNEWIFYRNLHPTDFGPADPLFVAWGGNHAKTGPGDPSEIWQLRPTRTVDPNLPPFNDTPYWLVRVPTAIIADHGDVWCPNSMNLLTTLVRLSGIAADGPKLRTITLRPEKAPPPGSDHLNELLDYESNAPTAR